MTKCTLREERGEQYEGRKVIQEPLKLFRSAQAAAIPLHALCGLNNSCINSPSGDCKTPGLEQKWRLCDRNNTIKAPELPSVVGNYF